MKTSYSSNPYVEEIASRLWSGHAAIMVGAGFSKNASKNIPSAPEFPDWAAIGDGFFRKANTKEPGSDDRYLNPLKLAEEVESAIGRPALNRLLREMIPDTEYDPSDLHRSLLSLPWTDVYTTNYDTLLERAAQAEHERKYDVVVSTADLINSERPRIVKLHGSFPSVTPFIITEEDYRTYPKKYAPFVNTVQQSLLENTLVLIGFSGDDPNFLSWIGWIRDNLRDTSQKIYLVGALNPSSSQKQLLERRNIIVVNLAGDESSRSHYEAISIFLDALKQGREQGNSLEWAHTVERRLGSKYKELVANREGIEQLIGEWKSARSNYPNWYILPVDQRSALASDVQACLEAEPASSGDPEIDLVYYNEFVWRLSHAFMPLPPEFLQVVIDLLEKLKPTDSPLTSGWAQREPTWVSLAISILKFCRYEGDLTGFTQIDGLLSLDVLALEPENIARIGFERCLFEFSKLNIEGVRRELDRWPINESIPMSEARRAGLLGELGDLQEAKEIINRSLQEVRSRLKLSPVKDDFELVSAEAQIMALSEEIELAASLAAGKFDETQRVLSKYRDRRNDLRVFKCDPWNELQLFWRELEQPSFQKEERVERVEFDIGQTTTKFHLYLWDESALAGYAFLRFSEEAGLPFRFGNVTTRTSLAAGAVGRLKNHFPALAFVTFVRIGDPTQKLGGVAIVEMLFDRKAMYGMSTESVEKLAMICIECYTYCLDHEQKGGLNSNFEFRMLCVLPEVLSRLVTKSSGVVRDSVAKLIPQIYSSVNLQNERFVVNLMTRLGQALSNDEVVANLDVFLRVPFAKNRMSLLPPLAYLRDPKGVGAKHPKPSRLLVDKMRDGATSTDIDEVKWYLICLNILDRMSLLSVDMRAELGGFIWESAEVVPTQSPFYLKALLELPHPAEIDPEVRIITHIENLELSQRLPEDRSVEFYGPEEDLFFDLYFLIRNIEVDQHILAGLLGKLMDWWGREKFSLSMTSGHFGPDVTARFKKLANLAAVSLQQFDDKNLVLDLRPGLESMMEELRMQNIPVLHLKSALAIACGERPPIRQIESSIASYDEAEFRDGLEGLWFCLRDTPTEVREDAALKSLVVDALKWKSGESLVQIFNYLHDLIENKKISLTEEFTSELTAKLAASVDYSALDASKSHVELAFRLSLREAACRLARTLYDATQNESLLIWRQISRNAEEFVEVRNGWPD